MAMGRNVIFTIAHWESGAGMLWLLIWFLRNDLWKLGYPVIFPGHLE